LALFRLRFFGGSTTAGGDAGDGTARLLPLLRLLCESTTTMISFPSMESAGSDSDDGTARLLPLLRCLGGSTIPMKESLAHDVPLLVAPDIPLLADVTLVRLGFRFATLIVMQGLPDS